MIKRCYDINNQHYPRYGGVGVTVDVRWFSFENYLEDLSQIDGYNPVLYHMGLLSLDKDIKQLYLPKSERVYSKDTCVFIDKKTNDEFRSHCFPIYSIDEYNNTIKYGSIVECGNKAHVTASNIIACLTGKKESHRGFKYMKAAMRKVPEIPKAVTIKAMTRS